MAAIVLPAAYATPVILLCYEHAERTVRGAYAKQRKNLANERWAKLIVSA
jgi:hypothetical protein